ncbi:MAG: hypothetical protein ILA04_08080 [Prevotella sp.]|nr:hypothetical protein [Prevotella sp.]
MDLLFSLKDYSPDEFRQGYCEILKFCFSLLILDSLRGCFLLGKSVVMTESVDYMGVIVMLYGILTALSLLLVFHKDGRGVVLWGVSNVLYWAGSFLMGTIDLQLSKLIAWGMLQLLFISFLVSRKDGRSAWRVLFPQTN